MNRSETAISDHSQFPHRQQAVFHLKLRHFQVVGGVQVQPVMRLLPQRARQAQRQFGRDRTITPQQAYRVRTHPGGWPEVRSQVFCSSCVSLLGGSPRFQRLAHCRAQTERRRVNGHRCGCSMSQPGHPKTPPAIWTAAGRTARLRPLATAGTHFRPRPIDLKSLHRRFQSRDYP